MNRLMKYVLLLSGIFFLVGCVKENLDGCRKNFALKLSYTGDSSLEIIGDKIRNIRMYVFRPDDSHVTSFLVPEEELKAREVVLPELSKGSYRIVSVANTDNTGITDPTVGDCDEISFACSRHLAGGRTTSNDSLYYASTWIEVSDKLAEDAMVNFASSHYKIYTEVVGIDPALLTRSNGGFRLELCGLLPETNFENQVGGEPVTYYPELGNYDPATKSCEARFNIMRHIDSSVVLTLFNQDNEIVVQINLAEFLADHPDIDLTMNEVLIPISIRFKEVGVTITVPEWFIEEIDPEI